jgi:hypothetical protein
MPGRGSWTPGAAALDFIQLIVIHRLYETPKRRIRRAAGALERLTTVFADAADAEHRPVEAVHVLKIEPGGRAAGCRRASSATL